MSQNVQPKTRATRATPIRGTEQISITPIATSRAEVGSGGGYWVKDFVMQSHDGNANIEKVILFDLAVGIGVMVVVRVFLWRI